jgi:HD-GYP domain-containing protein (c-di-GMP phosphodiesterase class II)
MAHIPIRVSTLRGDQPIDFDAYVKINDKHVLYCRNGDSFEGVRLSRLKEKKLKKMFIIEEQETNYRNYLQRNIDMAYDASSGKPMETRAEIVQGATQAKTEEVLENAGNASVYNETKADVLRFVEFLNKESTALGHILNLENVDNSIAHHGVAVSSIAIGLAARLGIKDPKQTQMLSLGGLLHDYEHFHSGLKIGRPMGQFSPEELALYKKHPMDGLKRLQDKQHFDQQVLTIIREHEETVDGNGFPNGMKDNKIDGLALIVGSANRADRLLTFERMPRKDIPRNLMINFTGAYPLEHLKILGELLKI